ncbi:MAG: flagellar basal body rod protein FlgC [Deltaproteobacteria bacterium]|jgi:flagellar basal-body rod protein FlgC
MALSVFKALELAGRALSSQRTRLDVVSGNLANAQTTAPDGEVGYRRRDVVLSAEPARNDFGRLLRDDVGRLVDSVQVEDIREDDAPPRMVHDPSHPHANEDGYVAYPNVSPVEEMVDMITTMRAYQANLNVLTAVREMAQRAFNIGRGV